MAPKPKTLTITSLILSLNLLFFTSVTSTYIPSRPTPTPSPPPPQSSTPSLPSPPQYSTPSPPPPQYSTPSPPPPATGNNNPTTTCPLNALSLGVCANLLGDLLSISIGSTSSSGCCSLISGLLDLEAVVCLCLAIDISLLGIVNLDVPVSLTLLLNACNVNAPSGFQCPTTT